MRTYGILITLYIEINKRVIFANSHQFDASLFPFKSRTVFKNIVYSWFFERNSLKLIYEKFVKVDLFSIYVYQFEKSSLFYQTMNIKRLTAGKR